MRTTPLPHPVFLPRGSSALLGFLAGVLAASGVACSGGGDVTVSDPDGGVQRSAPTPASPSVQGSSSTSTRPAGATAVTCARAEDCGQWLCECSSGAPVNARSCTNGFCLDAAHSCPKACADFDETWSGRAGGGPTKTSGTGSPMAECAQHDDCAALSCTCTSGFQQQMLSVQPKCMGGACTPKIRLCTEACVAVGQAWTGT